MRWKAVFSEILMHYRWFLQVSLEKSYITCKIRILEIFDFWPKFTTCNFLRRAHREKKDSAMGNRSSTYYNATFNFFLGGFFWDKNLISFDLLKYGACRFLFGWIIYLEESFKTPLECQSTQQVLLHVFIYLLLDDKNIKNLRSSTK